MSSPPPADSGNLRTNINVGGVTITDSKRRALKESGFSEAQIEALLSLADPNDQGNSLSPFHFYTVDKTTLSLLQNRGKLSSAVRQIVELQSPVSLMKQVGNPANWQGDNYIGPGASVVNAYTNGESVDFSKTSIDTLVMAVLIERSEILGEQLKNQINDIKARNDKIAEANKWLAEAKDRKADAGTGRAIRYSNMNDYWNKVGAKQSAGTTSTYNSVSYVWLNSSEWDVDIEGLKGVIEEWTSDSQLASTKMQQTVNKYNQSFEMISNFINKYYQSLSTIIQNLK